MDSIVRRPWWVSRRLTHFPVWLVPFRLAVILCAEVVYLPVVGWRYTAWVRPTGRSSFSSVFRHGTETGLVVRFLENLSKQIVPMFSKREIIVKLHVAALLRGDCFGAVIVRSNF